MRAILRMEGTIIALCGVLLNWCFIQFIFRECIGAEP